MKMQLLPIFSAFLALAAATPIVPGAGLTGVLDGLFPSCKDSSSKFHCLKERAAEAIVPIGGGTPACAKSSSKFHCLKERTMGYEGEIEAREPEQMVAVAF